MTHSRSYSHIMAEPKCNPNLSDSVTHVSQKVFLSELETSDSTGRKQRREFVGFYA